MRCAQPRCKEARWTLFATLAFCAVFTQFALAADSMPSPLLIEAPTSEEKAQDDAFWPPRSQSVENGDVVNCCASRFWYMCPHCYGSCILRPDPVKNFGHLLEQRLHGQDHAHAALIEMFDKHFGAVSTSSWLPHFLEKTMTLNRNGLATPQATTFHVAGDNGSGKSHLVSLMAESMFVDGMQHGCALVLSGENFIGQDPATTAEHRKTIFRQVVAQLKRNPTSLIVIDDVQYVHGTTLVVLQQFMDNTVPNIVTEDGELVDKSRALIGIVSDFGTEGQTHGMNFSQLEELVTEHTARLWGVAANAKQLQLIQYTIPFRALSVEAIARIAYDTAAMELPRIVFNVDRVALSPRAARIIAERVRQAFPHENGRGVSKWIQRHLLPPLRRTASRYERRLAMEVDVDQNTHAFEFRPIFEFGGGADL